jgi:hypothetical protein
MVHALEEKVALSVSASQKRNGSLETTKIVILVIIKP